MAFTLAACEGPMGPVGPMGPPGVPGQNGQNGQDGDDGRDGEDGEGTKAYTQEFTILPHHWQLVGNPNELNSFFVATKQFDRLTQDVYESGSVIAYVENHDGVKNGMPFVWHKGGLNDWNEEILWTETYDFDFTVGEVRFYLTYSDFSTDITPDEIKTFHIVLLWN